MNTIKTDNASNQTDVRQPATALSLTDWKQVLADYDLPTYRAGQIRDWLFKKCVASFDQMKNLPANLRERLAADFPLAPIELIERYPTPDNKTVRWLTQAQDGARIEAVSILTAKRHTVCLSSQVGCAVGCTFCASGLDGFQRNLTAFEILEPVRIATRELKRRVSNVVMMGTGEPMSNLDAVLDALDIINDENGLNIGARRMTISTAGVPSGIRRLATVKKQYGLAVSLHTTDDALRDQLVPLNKQYPVSVVIDAIRDYVVHTGRQATIEYVLLADINDRSSDAQSLASHLSDIPLTKVNLIPFNPVAGLAFKRPTRDRIDAFCAVLSRRGIINTVRFSSGADVNAACGQLRRRHPV